ncbi:MAG: hypothetical protein ABEI86_09495 [Halobacteriaceae archaeon]
MGYFIILQHICYVFFALLTKPIKQFRLFRMDRPVTQHVFHFVGRKQLPNIIGHLRHRTGLIEFIAGFIPVVAGNRRCRNMLSKLLQYAVDDVVGSGLRLGNKEM